MNWPFLLHITIVAVCVEDGLRNNRANLNIFVVEVLKLIDFEDDFNDEL